MLADVHGFTAVLNHHSKGGTRIADSCSPQMKIQPNGTYFQQNITAIYDAHVTQHSQTQTNTEQWCQGKLSFGLLNASTYGEDVEEGGRLLPLFADLAVASLCIQAFDNQGDCSIVIGLVELVSKEEALFIYNTRPEGSLMMKNSKLIQPGGYAYLLNLPLTNMPFMKLPYAYSTFETPDSSNSVMTLLASTWESINLTCNIDNWDANGLNHSEYLVEKVMLVVPINREQDPKSIPIAVIFQYFANIEVYCSGETLTVTEKYGLNNIHFLQGDETETYRDALKAMAANGWEHYWREPLDFQSKFGWKQGRCTLNPFGATDFPNCDDVLDISGHEMDQVSKAKDEL